MRLTPGTRVGPYEVVALLGAGGMAEVYRARDTRLGRDVAIKVVSEALGSDGAFLERFDREAKLAASLAHPNIVALHDVGFHDGKPYFVTELLQGEPLRERLAKGPIPLTKALEWAAQMARGLAAAHERSIVHRDLKPENVFVTRDGHVKLLDFGIAKLVEEVQTAAPDGLMDATVSPSGSSTGTGMVLGTPGYMSPEQVRGDAIDARTDFFSLGTVLYEMLSGSRAFPAGSVVESGYAILHNEPEPLPVTVPPQVAQVVNRCLEKDPARRFQSARDLAFNLELVRSPTGIAAATATVSGAPARPSRWRRWIWPLAATLALLGLTAMYLVERGQRLRIPSVKQLTVRRGTVSAGRFTSDGRVLYSATWGAEPEEIFAQVPGTPDTQTLGVHARLLSISVQGDLAVSLQSVWYGIGALGRGGTLALVPGAGGAPRGVTEDVVYADWSRTGELAVVRYVAGKRQLEYPLGTVLFETTGYILFPRVSPAGDAVAFWNWPLEGSVMDRELTLVDRKGAVRHFLHEPYISGLAWTPSGEEVWFTDGRALWSSPLSGGRRLLYQSVSQIGLEDISRDGKVLLNVEDSSTEMEFVPPGEQRERDLTWLSANFLVAISDDGHKVLFTSLENGGSFSYIRPTDGSSPLKLGPGWALALSPDEKWVLVEADEDQSMLSFLPVGVGVPKKLSASLNVAQARWLRDGERLVVTAQRKGDKQWRLFVMRIDGGAPTLLSEEPIGPYFLEVSRDDRLASVVGLDGTLIVYPLDGGHPISIPDLGKFSFPAGWTSEGHLWVSVTLKASPNLPSRLLRYDIAKRRIVEERTLAPADLTGVELIGRICITPDSRNMAVEYSRSRGYLFLLDGLAAPRR
jgi:tRNA A-37 threonylcarbamoyl transferase component Bud32